MNEQEFMRSKFFSFHLFLHCLFSLSKEEGRGEDGKEKSFLGNHRVDVYRSWWIERPQNEVAC